MGGVAVAKPLIAAGLDVLLVEAGGFERDDPSRSLVAAEMAGHPLRIPVSRAIEVGGGSNLWHGICAPLDDIDFAERAWIPHSGWPIGSGDLKSYYRLAHAMLVGEDGADEGKAEWRGEVALDPAVMRMKSFRFRSPPARLKETVRAWLRDRQVRCLVHAAALELVADETATVRHLVIGAAGATHTIEAKLYVVAAGALETPRLLLNSRARSDAGLGSGAARTGNFLMDHPAGHFCQLSFRRALRLPIRPDRTGSGRGLLGGLVLLPEVQERHAVPNHYAFLRPGNSAAIIPNELLMSFLGVRRAADLSLRQIWSVLTSGYIRRRILHQQFGLGGRSRWGDLFFMGEQLPDPQSRVSRSMGVVDGFGYPRACVDWRLGPADLERFGTYLAVLLDSLGQSAEVLSVRRDKMAEWAGLVSSAAHHLGTARMASSPAKGVVDSRLALFGGANVFVCDGSVFPTAGSVNPSLTIVALGLRLGEDLVARWRSRSALGARTVTGECA